MLSLAPRSALIISRKASTRAALFIAYLVELVERHAHRHLALPRLDERDQREHRPVDDRHDHADDHQKPEKCRHVRLSPPAVSRLSPYETAVRPIQGRRARSATASLDAFALFMCIRAAMSEDRGQTSAAHEPPATSRPNCLRRLGTRSIVFVGLMGAGKTAIGRKVAAALGLAFRRQRPRDRGGVAHDHPRAVRTLWRGRVPRARAARDRPHPGELARRCCRPAAAPS